MRAAHARALPTWNYLAVHLTGTLHVHHEPDWLRTESTAPGAAEIEEPHVDRRE